MAQKTVDDIEVHGLAVYEGSSRKDLTELTQPGAIVPKKGAAGLNIGVPRERQCLLLGSSAIEDDGWVLHPGEAL